MKRRLYFVLPDKVSAKRIERELLRARVEPSRIRFLANSDTAAGDLPKAGPLQKNDLAYGLRDGVLSGAVTGAVMGLVLYLSDVLAAPGAPLGMALLGASFGSWAGSLIAVSVPNRQLKPFEKDLKEGRLVLMVDVANDRVDEVTQLVTGRLPEPDARIADLGMAA
jgi:uncharacterized membrane protein